MARKDMPASRERRMRRAAARKGLAVRKLERGQDRGRYQLIDPEFGGPRTSPSRAHPESFSLEEAERYVERDVGCNRAKPVLHRADLEPARATVERVHRCNAANAYCTLRIYRGRSVRPIRNLSMAWAAWRPSRIAHTTRLWPRRMSPARTPSCGP